MYYLVVIITLSMLMCLESNHLPWQCHFQLIEIQFPHQNENSSTYLTLSLNCFPTLHVHSVLPPVGKVSPTEQ